MSCFVQDVSIVIFSPPLDSCETGVFVVYWHGGL